MAGTPFEATWGVRTVNAAIVELFDAEMTIDIDTVGDGTAKGLKVTLIGYRP